jgi:tRNA nucleotidyltransferase/poly(A) polymerase
MKFPQDILDIKKKFDDAGKELLLVGGSVRDMILGVTPTDFDFATDANVEEITKILSGYRFELQGAHFGVTRVFTGTGDYEIASYREDVTYGRKPEVKLGVTMSEDARRRDFSINAMYYDITKDEIHDTVWGCKDLAEKVIRTPGDARVILKQDKLRMLRAVRFKNKIGGTYHQNIIDAIREDNQFIGLNSVGEMEPIHQNRLVEEFLKGIKQAQKVSDYITDLKEFGFLEQIFKHKYPWGSCVESKSAEIVIARLLTVLSVLEHKELEALSEKLVQECNFSTHIAKGVVFLLKLQKVDHKTAFDLAKHKPSNITEGHILEFASHLKEIGDTKNYENIIAFSRYKPSVDGAELKRMGFSGELLGKEQHRLEEEIFKKIIQDGK